MDERDELNKGKKSLLFLLNLLQQQIIFETNRLTLLIQCECAESQKYPLNPLYLALNLFANN